MLNCGGNSLVSGGSVAVESCCVYCSVGAANLIALSIGNPSLGQSNAQPFELEGLCMTLCLNLFQLTTINPWQAVGTAMVQWPCRSPGCCDRWNRRPPQHGETDGHIVWRHGMRVTASESLQPRNCQYHRQKMSTNPARLRIRAYLLGNNSLTLALVKFEEQTWLLLR